MVHHSPIEYNIVPSMRQELDFFEEFLKPDSGVSWESPLAFLIKRMPFAKSWGDACLDACGGFSIKLEFFWFIEFPKNIVQRTLKHLADNGHNNLISINVLEFFTIIINYCGALTALKNGNYTSDPHPILLNMTDNTSTHSWTNHTCKNSRLGKLLAKFFCYLLMDSPLGINSKWLSTTDNVIADDISRIKKLNATSSKQFSFDYSLLQQKYPQLNNCRFYQPSPDLLLALWEILLHGKLASLKEVRKLKQAGLGKLITLNGAQV